MPERRGVSPPTPRNHTQETAVSVQIVPGMRFLVLHFALYPMSGTHREYAAIKWCDSLVSGTDVAYDAIDLRDVQY
eukprot:815555-Rhodomonas_salina.7